MRDVTRLSDYHVRLARECAAPFPLIINLWKCKSNAAFGIFVCSHSISAQHQQQYESSKQHDAGGARFAHLNTIRRARNNRPPKVVVKDGRSTVVRKYPQMFHMAELGSWPSIQKHGLPSTSSLLVTRDLSQRVVCHYRFTRTGPFGRGASQMPSALNWQNNFRVPRDPPGIGDKLQRHYRTSHGNSPRSAGVGWCCPGYGLAGAAGYVDSSATRAVV